MNWPWSRKQADAEPVPQDDDEAATIRNQLKELVQDLITLEVNTIIKENMVAGPMPTIPNALIEIAGSYLYMFQSLRLDVSKAYALKAGSREEEWKAAVVIRAPEGAKSGFFEIPQDPIQFGHLFEFIRWAAHNSLVAFAGELRKRDLILLRRIEDNADRIRAVLYNHPNLRENKVRVFDIQSRRDLFIPPPKLTPHERLTIKKIWEVGTERVIAQTVIQIDGDIVTRIAKDFQDMAGTREDADQLLTLHQQGLDTAILRWNSLVTAAQAVVTGLTGNIFGGRA